MWRKPCRFKSCPEHHPTLLRSYGWAGQIPPEVPRGRNLSRRSTREAQDAGGLSPISYTLRAGASAVARVGLWRTSRMASHIPLLRREVQDAGGLFPHSCPQGRTRTIQPRINPRTRTEYGAGHGRMDGTGTDVLWPQKGTRRAEQICPRKGTNGAKADCLPRRAKDGARRDQEH